VFNKLIIPSKIKIDPCLTCKLHMNRLVQIVFVLEPEQVHFRTVFVLTVQFLGSNKIFSEMQTLWVLYVCLKYGCRAERDCI
jgi:hypothetical protein